MKVVVLTTSYPTPANPVAGNFVAASVEARARRRGRGRGRLARRRSRTSASRSAAGSRRTCARAPWKLALVPPFLAAFARAARRAARDADLVHAHWIPSAIAARATGKPYVLQVWGTDVALARRAPVARAPARARRARRRRGVDVPRRRGARARRARGARSSRAGVGCPRQSASRTSRRTCSSRAPQRGEGDSRVPRGHRGLPRVIVGDGPLRDRVPEAVGFVPPARARRRTTSARRSCASLRGARATG